MQAHDLSQKGRDFVALTSLLNLLGREQWELFKTVRGVFPYDVSGVYLDLISVLDLISQGRHEK
jgi:hypothetical protein